MRKATLLIIMMLLSACGPSEEQVKMAIAATQFSATKTVEATEPTATPTLLPITKDSYYKNLYPTIDKLVDVQNRKGAFGMFVIDLSGSDKLTYMNLMDEELGYYLLLAKEPPAPGYEMVQTNLQKAYEAEEQAVSCMKFVLGGGGYAQLPNCTAAIEQTTLYFSRAFDILKK